MHAFDRQTDRQNSHRYTASAFHGARKTMLETSGVPYAAAACKVRQARSTTPLSAPLLLYGRAGHLSMFLLFFSFTHAPFLLPATALRKCCCLYCDCCRHCGSSTVRVKKSIATQIKLSVKLSNWKFPYYFPNIFLRSRSHRFWSIYLNICMNGITFTSKNDQIFNNKIQFITKFMNLSLIRVTSNYI